MILLFVVANGMLAAYLVKGHPTWGSFFIALLLAISFFFRLRLFDELKDEETDRKVNPTRPLVRGLLSSQAVKNAAYVLIAFEVILSAFVGVYALLPMLVAIGYSLLMYNEFFIGTWLRTQLLLYAITHTVVVIFLGYALAVVVTGNPLWSFPGVFFLSGIMNWNLFNIFEISRKSFAPDEERPHVESYTSLYGLWRAVRLSLAQAFLATIFGELMIGQAMIGFFWGLLVLCFFAAAFVVRGTPIYAKIYRKLSGAFILYIYLVIILILWNRL
jgi:4-hydroxybenzoate polyprenyltransferase